MKVKLGLIVFANDSGLGYQTKRLAEMLKPDRLLVIDSNGFSKNKAQHYEWYEGFSGYRVHGFPNNHEIRVFLKDLTHVLCAENPLNYSLTSYAQQMGIKVYIQTNYEFNDFLDKPNLVLPYKFLMPSFWKVADMEQRFGRQNVIYLPPPIDPSEFAKARGTNFSRGGPRRFLHIVGTLATHDRNGTLDLLDAIMQTEEDFELVIHSQHLLPPEYITDNRKVKYIVGTKTSPSDLYTDFDALIMPRRYGGLCLPVCEALMSAIPVIMPDIDPNNKLLPRSWLVEADKSTQFQARTMIDVYKTNIKALAKKMDEFCIINIAEEKIKAFELGYENFAVSKLKDDYARLWK